MINHRAQTRLKIMFVALLIPAGPAFGLTAQKSPPANTGPAVVSTMPGMRALVPPLVVTGWMDFFLDLRQPMGLTDAQVRKLSLIRQSYLAALQRQSAILSHAELNLYQDMASDVVTSKKLGKDLQTISELKASIAEAHFTAVLEAINVLNHRQHLKADEWLKISLEQALHKGRDEPGTDPIPTKTKRSRSRLFHWSSSVTPLQLLGKAW